MFPSIKWECWALMSMYRDHIIYHPSWDTERERGHHRDRALGTRHSVGRMFTLLIRLLQPQKPPFFCVTSSEVLTMGPFLDFVSVLGVVWAFPLVAGDAQQP